MVSKKHDSQRIRLEVPRVVQGSSGSQRARERSCGWGGSGGLWEPADGWASGMAFLVPSGKCCFVCVAVEPW